MPIDGIIVERRCAIDGEPIQAPHYQGMSVYTEERVAVREYIIRCHYL